LTRRSTDLARREVTIAELLEHQRERCEVLAAIVARDGLQSARDSLVEAEGALRHLQRRAEEIGADAVVTRSRR
jgi:uncharacterized protein YbjQ (UPF0145 family)